ncbi:hypothetical protein clg_41 [Corynebacterium phage CL31]|nr:hypothetical protein clg_41 [Corynebacterium phage CL31]
MTLSIITITERRGVGHPPLTLPHGAVCRKPGSASTMHVGRVKVTHIGANSGNISGHTPGGRGTRTRAAIDHLINVLDLAEGIEAGSSITLNINTGAEKNEPELHHMDNLTQTDGVAVKPYSDVQVALWGIQHALMLDHEDVNARFLRELHTYKLDIS